jgi:ribosomal protein S27AE
VGYSYDRTARWIAEHPQQRLAQLAVRRAIQDGLLTVPERCTRCGERTVITSHHEDYSKPFEVTWLCHWCHFCRHQELKGLPVPAQRRSRVPAFRPRSPKAAPHRPPGRPRTLERCLRPLPTPKRRTYGQFDGQPVVLRNTRPAIRWPEHPLARSGYVYVEDLIVHARLGRPRQWNDDVKYLDGNRWNWADSNVSVSTRETHPRVHAWLYENGYVSFSGVDLDPEKERELTEITHGKKAGYLRNRGWPLKKSISVFKRIRKLGVEIAVAMPLVQAWTKLGYVLPGARS